MTIVNNTSLNIVPYITFLKNTKKSLRIWYMNNLFQARAKVTVECYERKLMPTSITRLHFKFFTIDEKRYRISQFAILHKHIYVRNFNLIFFMFGNEF